MGFEQLEKAVLQKTQKDAGAILGQAEKEKKEILAKADAEIKTMKKKSDEEVQQLIGMMEKKGIAQSQLEVKKMLLMVRKELIDRVFDEVSSRLSKSFSKIERKELLQNLRKKAEKEIDVGKVYCSKADLGMLKGAVAGDMSGGLIAESRDGRIMVDYSFETRLEEIKEKDIKEITGLLFR